MRRRSVLHATSLAALAALAACDGDSPPVTPTTAAGVPAVGVPASFAADGWQAVGVLLTAHSPASTPLGFLTVEKVGVRFAAVLRDPATGVERWRSAAALGAAADAGMVVIGGRTWVATINPLPAATTISLFDPAGKSGARAGRTAGAASGWRVEMSDVGVGVDYRNGTNALMTPAGGLVPVAAPKLGGLTGAMWVPAGDGHLVSYQGGGVAMVVGGELVWRSVDNTPNGLDPASTGRVGVAGDVVALQWPASDPGLWVPALFDLVSGELLMVAPEPSVESRAVVRSTDTRWVAVGGAAFDVRAKRYVPTVPVTVPHTIHEDILYGEDEAGSPVVVDLVTGKQFKGATRVPLAIDAAARVGLFVDPDGGAHGIRLR